MDIKTITGSELREAVRSQGLPLLHRAFKCPLCETTQSAFDFIKAGAAQDFDGATKLLARSCIGRFTGASAARKDPDGKPCDWLVGGFLQLHTTELLDDDGERYPIFEPASRDEARAHAEQNEPGILSGSYNFDDFIREAAELNLTAADLVAALAPRPEFADCLPPPEQH